LIENLPKRATINQFIYLNREKTKNDKKKYRKTPAAAARNKL